MALFGRKEKSVGSSFAERFEEIASRFKGTLIDLKHSLHDFKGAMVDARQAAKKLSKGNQKGAYKEMLSLELRTAKALKDVVRAFQDLHEATKLLDDLAETDPNFAKAHERYARYIRKLLRALKYELRDIKAEEA